MKGNLKAPIWIIPVLILVMAIGAFAAVVALNHSTAGTTEASNLDGMELTGVSNIGGDGLVTATHSITANTAKVTELTGSIFPDDPGDPTRLRLDFIVSGTTTSTDVGYAYDKPDDADEGGLKPGDEIIITLEDDFGFVVETPLVLSRIDLSASIVTNDPPTSVAGQTVTPDGVNVDFSGDENDLLQITVTVPDMGTADGSGANGIADGATVTVIFHQGAGIVNARESNDYRTRVTTTKDVDFAEFRLNVIARLLLSDDDDDRGSKEPLLVLGIEGKESATIWLDYDGDGKRDANERDLCNFIADPDDTGQCTIVLNNPPFFPGLHGPGGSCELPNMVNCNFINFVGSEGRTTGSPLELTQEQVNRQTMNLLGNINISPRAANVGDTVTVSLFDFPSNAPIDLIQVLTGLNVSPSNLPLLTGPSGEVSFGWTIPGVAPNCIPFGTGTGVDSTTKLFVAIASTTDTIILTVNSGTPILPGMVIQIDKERFVVSAVDGTTVKVTRGANTTIAANHDKDAGVDILSSGVCITERRDNNPRAGERIPTGLLRVDIKSGEGTVTDSDDSGTVASFNLTISGANLSVSHGTVIANQDLTISGNGFSEGSNNCIFEGQITIGNVPVEIADDSDCPQSVMNASTLSPKPTWGILLTTGGTFTITVRVHDAGIAGTQNILSSSLLNEATHELKVIDSNGAEGNLPVTIAERTLDVAPLTARPRDVVTIIGRNFISDNQDGLSTTVTVKYDCGASSRTVTADPDASGNFRESLRIPSGCAIPSTNTLSAEISADGKKTGVVETVTHEIPAGLIIIEPGRGASGTRVTLRGEGFRTFETVEKVEFGGLGTLGSRNVNTDGAGNFTITDLLVPGLDPGIHSVKVEVSTGSNRTTSSISFEVLESGLIGAPTPMEDVYAMSDSLLRIFRFDNNTKTWEFNDSREEFADANTLDELVTGGVYWLLIDQDVELDVIGVLLNLTCTGDDCWNLVVWP